MFKQRNYALFKNSAAYKLIAYKSYVYMYIYIVYMY